MRDHDARRRTLGSVISATEAVLDPAEWAKAICRKWKLSMDADAINVLASYAAIPNV